MSDHWPDSNNNIHPTPRSVRLVHEKSCVIPIFRFFPQRSDTDDKAFGCPFLRQLLLANREGACWEPSRMPSVGIYIYITVALLCYPALIEGGEEQRAEPVDPTNCFNFTSCSDCRDVAYCNWCEGSKVCHWTDWKGNCSSTTTCDSDFAPLVKIIGIVVGVLVAVFCGLLLITGLIVGSCLFCPAVCICLGLGFCLSEQKRHQHMYMKLQENHAINTQPPSSASPLWHHEPVHSEHHV